MPTDLPIIQGVTVGEDLNLSGIGHDVDKLRAMPEGIQETDGYRRTSSDRGEQTQRHYLVPWSQCLDAEVWWRGYSTSLAITSPGNPAVVYQLSRIIPAQDPKFPWLYCSAVDLVKGQGAWLPDPTNYAVDSQGNVQNDNEGNPIVVPAIAYVDNRAGTLQQDDPLALPRQAGFFDGYALYRVTFTDRNYSVLNDTQSALTGLGEVGRYVEREVDPTVEALPLPRIASNTTQPLKFTAGPAAGQIVPEAGILLLPSAQVKLTWYDVPDVPWQAIFNTLGKVNVSTFDANIPGYPGYSASTLLFLQPRVKRGRNVAGRVNFTITYRFAVRGQGWNAFPAIDGNFYLATFGGGAVAGDNSNLVYKPFDFSQLFTVPAPATYQ